VRVWLSLRGPGSGLETSVTKLPEAGSDSVPVTFAPCLVLSTFNTTSSIQFCGCSSMRYSLKYSPRTPAIRLTEKTESLVFVAILVVCVLRLLSNYLLKNEARVACESESPKYQTPTGVKDANRSWLFAGLELLECGTVGFT
jgi:hypothetical protein